MPRRERAPQVTEITATDHKSRKRRIKRLIDLRLGYGKSAFFNTHTHQPLYPIDEIAQALYKAERKAIKLKRALDLSTEEEDLWKQIFKVIALALGACFLLFYTDLDGNGVPDFFEFLNRTSPDFIEKALGLEDDAIEKSLGLPNHSVEHCCRRMAENDR